MDASRLYVLRDEPCGDCDATGWMPLSRHGESMTNCPACMGSGGRTRVPLIDALRALGIDVPEPEEPVAERCPP